MEEILKELERLRQDHFILDEDNWYSCPKSGRCLNDKACDRCNCGADETNRIIDNIIILLKNFEKK